MGHDGILSVQVRCVDSAFRNAAQTRNAGTPKDDRRLSSEPLTRGRPSPPPGGASSGTNLLTLTIWSGVGGKRCGPDATPALGTFSLQKQSHRWPVRMCHSPLGAGWTRATRSLPGAALGQASPDLAIQSGCSRSWMVVRTALQPPTALTQTLQFRACSLPRRRSASPYASARPRATVTTAPAPRAIPARPRGRPLP